MGYSVSRLADELSLERSKASRLTQELVDRGMLAKGHDGTLRIAETYFTLAEALNHGFFPGSRSLMRSIAVRHGVAVRLSVLDDVLVRMIRAESSSSQRAWPVNRVTPCWCTGSGRALLLDHDLDEISTLLEGYQMVGVGGPNAARNPQELAEANARDRSTGIVAAHEEFEHGLSEFAVPLRNAQGRISSALAVVGRSEDIAHRAEEIRAALCDAAGTLMAPEPQP